MGLATEDSFLRQKANLDLVLRFCQNKPGVCLKRHLPLALVFLLFLVVFTGNLSLLDILLFFPGGLSKWRTPYFQKSGTPPPYMGWFKANQAVPQLETHLSAIWGLINAPGPQMTMGNFSRVQNIPFSLVFLNGHPHVVQGPFDQPPYLSRSPSTALSLALFDWEGFPTKIDYRQMLVPTYSNLSGGPSCSTLSRPFWIASMSLALSSSRLVRISLTRWFLLSYMLNRLQRGPLLLSMRLGEVPVFFQGRLSLLSCSSGFLQNQPWLGRWDQPSGSPWVFLFFLVDLVVGFTNGTSS